MNAGPEAEFFLFQTKNGIPTTETHDAASYFDLSPVDQGEDVRREIVLALEAMGFHVEAAHHEVAAGPARDRLPLRRRADDGGQHQHVPVRREERRDPATGCTRRSCPSRSTASTARACTRTCRCSRNGANIFFDAEGQWQLSPTCLYYIGGHPAARARVLRDHQPARQLVQAPGARLRSADQHRLVGEQPEPARARAGRARRCHAHRAPDARSVVQPVPGAGRDAAIGPGRHRQAESTRDRPSTRTSTR